MSYIGNTPTQQNFVAGADQFSGNGSTVAFTLSRSVNTVFDIFVTVANVPQDPFTAYTVSGNTLTFDGAPPSGTNNIDVVYRATNVQTFIPTPGVSTQLGLGSASAPSLTFIGDTNTGIYSPGADQVAIATGGTKRFEVNASGNAGLNITPSAWRDVDDVLQVGQGLFGGLATSSSTRRSYMGSNYYTNSSGQDIYVANGEASLYQQNNGAHAFLSATSGTAGNVATLTSILDVRLGKALALQGGAVDITGTGIAFPAAVNPSSNANTLDDYEEGVFEPIALGSGTAGTGTYTLQAGRYTKIGRVCFFQFTIGWSNLTGATGDLNLGGLPFTSLGADGEVVAGQSAATVGYVSGLSFTNQPNLYIPLNNTILVFTQTTTGGVVSGIPIDTAVAEIIVNGHYIVA